MNKNEFIPIESVASITSMRVTSWAKFNECPRRWRHESVVDSPLSFSSKHPVGNKYTRIGTGVHSVIEDYMENYQHDTNKDVFFEQAFAKYLQETEIDEKERTNVRKYCEEIQRAGWTFSNGNLLGTEIKVTSEIENVGVPVSGTMDAVLWDEGGQCWIILDHKTNRTYESAAVWSNKVQQKIYPMLLRSHLQKIGEERQEAPIDFCIGYVNMPGKFVRWRVDTAVIDDIGSEIAGYWAELTVYGNRNEWPERTNKYCNSCDLITRCSEASKSMDDLEKFALGSSAKTIKNNQPLMEITSLIKNYRRFEKLEGIASSFVQVYLELIQEYMTEKQMAEVRTEAGRVYTKEVERRFVNAVSVMKRIEEESKMSVLQMASEELIPADILEDLFTVNVGALDRLLKNNEIFRKDVFDDLIQKKKGKTQFRFSDVGENNE